MIVHDCSLFMIVLYACMLACSHLRYLTLQLVLREVYADCLAGSQKEKDLDLVLDFWQDDV